MSDPRAAKSWSFRHYTGRYDRSFSSQDSEQPVVPTYQKRIRQHKYLLHLHPQFTIFDAGMKISRILADMDIAVDPLDPEAPDLYWYMRQLHVGSHNLGSCLQLAHKLYHLWLNASIPPGWL